MRHHRHPDQASALGANKWRLWGKRIAWLVAIWTMSVAALAIVAGLMRLLMHMLGMR